MKPILNMRKKVGITVVPTSPSKSFPAHKHIERDSNKIGNLIYSNVAWQEQKREKKNLLQRKYRNSKQGFFKNKKYERVLKTTYRTSGEC